MSSPPADLTFGGYEAFPASNLSLSPPNFEVLRHCALQTAVSYSARFLGSSAPFAMGSYLRLQQQAIWVFCQLICHASSETRQGLGG